MLQLVLALWLPAAPLVAPAALVQPPSPHAPSIKVDPLALQADDEEAYRYLSGLQERGLHDLVVEAAGEFLKEHPRSTRIDLVRYRLGESLFELGRLSDAREPFEALAAKRGFERRNESRFRLAQCCLNAGDARPARIALEGLLKSDPGYLLGPGSVLLGEAWLGEGEPSRAADAYRSVLEGRFSSAEQLDARLGLAWCAREQGQHAEAVQGIEAFLAKAGEDDRVGEARLFRAEMLLAAERPEQARTAFAELKRDLGTRTAEDRRAIFRGLGLALAELGEWKAAADELEGFLKLSPQPERASEARLLCGAYRVRAEDPEAALAHLKSVNSAESFLWQARAQMLRSNPRAAVEAARGGLSRKPTADLSVQLQEELGDAASSVGDVDQALAAYASADTAYARHAGAALALGAQRWPAAREFALAAVRSDAEDGAHRRPAGWIAAEAALAQGDSRTAAAEFGALARADDRDDVGARSLARLSWAEWLNDDAQAAKSIATRFLELHAQRPESADQHFLLGRAHESFGEVQPALENYGAYLKSAEREHRPECLLRSSRLTEPEVAQERLGLLLGEFPGHEYVPEALYDSAELFSAGAEFEQAARRYDALLENHGGHALTAAARYGRAYCYLEADQPRECADLLERVVAGRSATADPSLQLAALELGVWANAQAGRLDRCEQFARSLFALELAPERALDAVRVAGDALKGNQRLEAAQQLYTDLAGVLTDPGARAEAEAEAAFLALDRKRLDEAEALVRRAQAKSPRSEAVTEAAFFVGEARFDAGQGTQAEALYLLATANPRMAPAALYKGGFSALRDERAADAEPRLSQLVKDHAQHELFGEGLYLLGEARFRLERFKSAIEPLERLRKELPRHASLPKALFRLGQCQSRSNQSQAAASTLADLKRRFGDFEWMAESELERGRALSKLDDRRGARAAFEDVLRRDDGVLAARARLELGRIEEREEAWERALDQFLKVAVLFEGTDEAAEALYASGGVLERLERFDAAAGRYREILDSYPESDVAALATERLADLGTR